MTRVRELRPLIAFALLAALGCQRGSMQHDAVASSTAGTAPLLSPSSASAASEFSGNLAPTSVAGAGTTEFDPEDCSAPRWHGFYMRVQGDGEEQEFTKGLPQVIMMPRPCAPLGMSLGGVRLIAGGCAGVAGRREMKSCIHFDGLSLRYYNRDGKMFELAVKPYEYKEVGDTIDGELETTAPLPGATTPLRVKFHVAVERNNY